MEYQRQILDGFVRRARQLIFLFLLVGVFAFVAQRDRTLLSEDLELVKSDALAYLLLTVELGGEAHIDDYDDDFLHIRTPGDDDFLRKGSIPEALLGVDMEFGGLITMKDGSRYRFQNGLSALLENGSVRTYNESDTKDIGLRLENPGEFNEMMIIEPSDTIEVAIETNSNMGDLLLTEFYVKEEGGEYWSHKFWASNGYFFQDYGGGDVEFFLEPRIVHSNYIASDDLAQSIKKTVQHWIKAEGAPYDQYARLAEYSEQQKFNIPLLGISGDIGVLEQVLWLVIFVLSVMLLHTAIGFFAYSDKVRCTEPWMVLHTSTDSLIISVIAYFSGGLGVLFGLICLLLPLVSTQLLRNSIEIDHDRILSIDTSFLIYPLALFVCTASYFLIRGLLRQNRL